MKKTMVRNMTEGNIIRQIMQFAVPLFFGMLFQQFYNVFDTMIVGKFLGVDALAGVGSTGSINFLVIGFCSGVANGCAIPLAQSFGSDNYEEFRKYMINSVYMAIVVIGLLTVLSCVLCKQILILMGTLTEVLDYAYAYILVIFIGIPITFAYNFLSGVLRSVGNSRTPVIFIVIATFINILLDLLFLAVLKLGVAFAAIATLISQIVSVVLCLSVILFKYDFLKLSKSEYKISLSRIGKLLWCGLPMGLQYSITAIGSISIQSAINSLNSTVYVAATTAAGKISSFLATPFDALGSTMATYGGQNVGAKKYDRLSKGMNRAALIAIIYSFFALATAFFFGDKLSLLFMDEYNEEIAMNARYMLIALTLFYIPLAYVNIVRFLIQGMGYSATAIIAGVLEMAGRVIAAFILVPKFGYNGACLASPIAWILADSFLLPCFFILRNKLMKKEAKII